MIILKLFEIIFLGLFMWIEIIGLGIFIPMIMYKDIFLEQENFYISPPALIKALFLWQVWVWRNTKATVNLVGRTLLIIIITIISFPHQIIMFIMLIIEEIIYWSFKLFIKIFGMEKENEDN